MMSSGIRRELPPSSTIEARGDSPSLLARLEVAAGNAVPVVGVVLLGWNAVTVVTLYVLDGWLCVLGLGASVMLRNRDELRALVPKTYGPTRRFLFLLVSVTLVQAILSMFALVPGVAVLAHVAGSPGAALDEAFRETGAWLSAAVLAASHVPRIGRAARGADEGVAALDPKEQMGLYAGRMFLMMFLAWLAAPGFLSRFLVPVYVASIAALFTYSDLYPRRFLALLGRGAQRTSDPGAVRTRTVRGAAKPKLPR
jgi:hypothetical protein